MTPLFYVIPTTNLERRFASLVKFYKTFNFIVRDTNEALQMTRQRSRRRDKIIIIES